MKTIPAALVLALALATSTGAAHADAIDDYITKKQELKFPSGTHWRFRYTGYRVLGMLITKGNGESYVDLLTRRVFAPLGMRTIRVMDYLAIIPNRAAGYELRNGELRNQEWV